MTATDSKKSPTGYKKGLLAETRGVLFLRLKGYRILETRFRTRFGEIDIVALKGNTIVFVEVKQRRTADDAAEAIHAKNQSRVADAALLYLQKHPEYSELDARFDALLLGRAGMIHHLENAWAL